MTAARSIVSITKSKQIIKDRITHVTQFDDFLSNDSGFMIPWPRFDRDQHQVANIFAEKKRREWKSETKMTEHEVKEEAIGNFMGYDLGDTNYYVYLMNEEIVCTEPANEAIDDANEFVNLQRMVKEKCELCDESFSSKDGLLEHHRMFHSANDVWS